MSKKTIITLAVVAGVTSITAGALYIWNKKKAKVQNKTNNSKIADEVVDESSGDEIIPDLECSEDKINKEAVIHKFIAYLVKNGVDAEEVVSICETISRIRYNLPDKFPEIKKKMIDMMNSEFDLKKSQEFDRENYQIMYSSIDPCQLFVKNGFKILSMGPDCQESMMNLADALADLQESDPEEAITVIYEIYHLLNDLESEDINPSTYDEKFKSYVDKYVKEDDLTELEIEDNKTISFNEVDENMEN